jgi:type I restriction enzyme S subunit
MTKIDEIRGAIKEVEIKPYAEVARGFTYFEENDILFAKITPSMQNGKCAIAHDLLDGFGFGSTEFHVLRPDRRVIPEWIFYYLRRLQLRLEAKEHFLGAVGQQRVPENFLAVTLIPLPPSIDLQRRIVGRVESLLVDLREAQNTLESMRQDIDQVTNSVLKEIFDDLFTSAQGWRENLVEELCYAPQYGYTQSATFEPVGPKFLRITDIQDDRVDWNLVPYCQIPAERLSTYLLQRGDILFARTGATTGKTFLIGESPTAVFASYLIRLRAKENILPELLAWFFKSRLYWDQIELGGSAQPNMNAQLLKKVKVRYPQSIQTQQWIVNYLDSIQDDVGELRNTLREDEEILNQVEEGILNQAFRGKL